MPIVFHATFSSMPLEWVPRPVQAPAPAEIYVPTTPQPDSIFEALPTEPELTASGEPSQGYWQPPSRLRHPDSVIDDGEEPQGLIPLRDVQRKPPPVPRRPVPMPTPQHIPKTTPPTKPRRICVKDVVMAYQLAANDAVATANVRAMEPSREVLRAAVRTFRDARKSCPGLEDYCRELGITPEALPPGRGRPKAGDVRTYVPQKVPNRDSYFIRLPLDNFHVNKSTRVEVEFNDTGMRVEVLSEPSS